LTAGQTIFDAIESDTGVDFAASSNATGNPTLPDVDWVMESDNIDIRDFYFYADRMEAFDGTFGNQAPDVVQLPLAQVDEGMLMPGGFRHGGGDGAAPSAHEQDSGVVTRAELKAVVPLAREVKPPSKTRAPLPPVPSRVLTRAELKAVVPMAREVTPPSKTSAPLPTGPLPVPGEARPIDKNTVTRADLQAVVPAARDARTAKLNASVPVTPAPVHNQNKTAACAVDPNTGIAQQKPSGDDFDFEQWYPETSQPQSQSSENSQVGLRARPVHRQPQPQAAVTRAQLKAVVPRARDAQSQSQSRERGTETGKVARPLPLKKEKDPLPMEKEKDPAEEEDDTDKDYHIVNLSEVTIPLSHDPTLECRGASVLHVTPTEMKAVRKYLPSYMSLGADTVARHLPTLVEFYEARSNRSVSGSETSEKLYINSGTKSVRSASVASASDTWSETSFASSASSARRAYTDPIMMRKTFEPTASKVGGKRKASKRAKLATQNAAKGPLSKSNANKYVNKGASGKATPKPAPSSKKNPSKRSNKRSGHHEATVPKKPVAKVSAKGTLVVPPKATHQNASRPVIVNGVEVVPPRKPAVKKLGLQARPVNGHEDTCPSSIVHKTGTKPAGVFQTRPGKGQVYVSLPKAGKVATGGSPIVRLAKNSLKPSTPRSPR
jgi:hypothetical protein